MKLTLPNTLQLAVIVGDEETRQVTFADLTFEEWTSLDRIGQLPAEHGDPFDLAAREESRGNCPLAFRADAINEPERLTPWLIPNANHTPGSSTVIRNPATVVCAIEKHDPPWTLERFERERAAELADAAAWHEAFWNACARRRANAAARNTGDDPTTPNQTEL